MHRGYIKYYRKIKEWEWRKDPYTFSLFMHFISNANFKDTSFMGHTIKRGQIVCSVRTLSEELGITPRSVRTSITRLKSTHEITQQTTRWFSIITVCNYDVYQCDEEKTTQQATHKTTTKRHGSDTEVTTSKERKECKEGKEIKDVVQVKQKPEHVEFVERFAALYQTKTGNVYKYDKKDFVIADKLIKSYGFEAVKEKAKILAVYCSGAGEIWFARNGWSDFTIGCLVRHWNSILPKLSEEKKIKLKSENRVSEIIKQTEENNAIISEYKNDRAS
jgi:hypothetical protein